MHVCLCKCIYLYTCMYTFMYMHKCMYMCMCMCINVHMYVCMNMCLSRKKYQGNFSFPIFLPPPSPSLECCHVALTDTAVKVAYQVMSHCNPTNGKSHIFCGCSFFILCRSLLYSLLCYVLIVVEARWCLFQLSLVVMV